MLGEAWGESEDNTGAPFVGWAGKELFEMTEQAWPGATETAAELRSWLRYDTAWVQRRGPWLESKSLGFTNVFNLRPGLDNDIRNLCAKKEALHTTGGFAPLVRAPSGLYLRPEFFHHLDRLEAELLALDPNIVIALGNTAMWALTGSINIGAIRGTIRQGSLGAWSGKVMPTYHPAGVLRQWEWRTICVADIAKAFRQADYREIRRPQRQVTVSPTLDEIAAWIAKGPGRQLACDIETAIKQITEIGFARAKDDAIVIPFIDRTKPGWNYWASPEDESRAWGFVEELLSWPGDTVFQNGLYDLQYILPLGFRPKGLRPGQDTMLRHHSRFPELQKGLGFLGSIYTEEPAWKLMRRKRPDTEKRDE